MPRLTFQDTFSKVQYTYWPEVAVEGHLHNAVHAFCQNRQTSMDKKVYQPQSKLKAKIWSHFGFWRTDGGRDLDMSYAVCRLHKCKVKYSSNTTNLHLHIARHHPEQQVLAVGAKEATPGNSVLSQPKMSETFKI